MTVRGRGVQSVEIAGRILVALTRAGRAMMLRDLAASAELAPAQAHAYLVSLRKLALVEQDVATGRYRLGPFALRLGLARLRVSDPLRMAAETIGLLSDQLDLLVAITVWGDHGPTVVQVHEAATQVHANVRAGTVFSLTGTATGRVFAAFAAPALVAEMIAAELANPTHSQRVAAGMRLEDVRRETAEVRAAGYAIADGAPVPGVSAIAAPVFDHGGQIELAVTVMGPSGLIDLRPESAQIAAVVAYAQHLSGQLGHAAPEAASSFTPSLSDPEPVASLPLRRPYGARR
jgi:DNA-binding IclR family transcriptional regulator